MSWPILEIQDFCRTGSGTTPSRTLAEYYDGHIPWVKSGELRETTIMDTEEKVTARALSETSLKLVPAGALLVAMYGATVGRIGKLGVEATTNQAVCHVVPDPKRADTQYMFHMLQARAEELIGRGVGGAQPNISQGIIKQLKIPLPPLEEQKRIAGILDQADALRRLRTRALYKLNTLGQVIFHEMFGRFQFGPEDWPTVDLGELVKDAKIGLVRGATEQGDELPVRYLRMDSISVDGALSFEGLRSVEANQNEIGSYGLTIGDFLLNTRNSRELVGKTAVVREAFDGVYNNNILRLRFDNRMCGAFLDSYLRTPSGRNALENQKSGTTSVFAIYQKSLMKIPIPLPPIELQRLFTERPIRN